MACVNRSIGWSVGIVSASRPWVSAHTRAASARHVPATSRWTAARSQHRCGRNPEVDQCPGGLLVPPDPSRVHLLFDCAQCAGHVRCVERVRSLAGGGDRRAEAGHDRDGEQRSRFQSPVAPRHRRILAPRWAVTTLENPLTSLRPDADQPLCLLFRSRLPASDRPVWTRPRRIHFRRPAAHHSRCGARWNVAIRRRRARRTISIGARTYRERRLGALLDRELSEIGAVLHGCRLPDDGFRVDHVVIGPNGLWLVVVDHETGTRALRRARRSPQAHRGRRRSGLAARNGLRCSETDSRRSCVRSNWTGSTSRSRCASPTRSGAVEVGHRSVSGVHVTAAHSLVDAAAARGPVSPADARRAAARLRRLLVVDGDSDRRS